MYQPAIAEARAGICHVDCRSVCPIRARYVSHRQMTDARCTVVRHAERCISLVDEDTVRSVRVATILCRDASLPRESVLPKVASKASFNERALVSGVSRG